MPILPRPGHGSLKCWCGGSVLYRDCCPQFRLNCDTIVSRRKVLQEVTLGVDGATTIQVSNPGTSTITKENKMKLISCCFCGIVIDTERPVAKRERDTSDEHFRDIRCPHCEEWIDEETGEYVR